MIEWDKARKFGSETKRVDFDDEFSPIITHSVGWLIRDGKRNKVLIQSFEDILGEMHEPGHGKISGILQIPTGSVRQIFRFSSDS